MNISISADTPITDKNDDKFNRYPFAKSIANLILNRECTESLVIGIYGKWGEGKTSVLNFVKSELRHAENVIVINFNPWIYRDEESMLNFFFSTLANNISSYTNKKDISKSKHDIINWINSLLCWNYNPNEKYYKKIGKLLYNYGGLISYKGIGKVLEKVGKKLSQIDIEVNKNQIGEIIQKSKVKIVITIDDIDRLNKEEIFLLLRIVKLTADFPNTIYILALDPEIVSSAIEERFINSNLTSDYNYLEKIIQLQLSLPHLSDALLERFCYELLENRFKEFDIELSTSELIEFKTKFNDIFTQCLKSPRNVLRYVNTIATYLITLKDEVNYIDMMIVIGLHQFYPAVYQFIKNYKREIFVIKRNLPLKIVIDIFNEEIMSLEQKYRSRDRDNIKTALVCLFPFLHNLWKDKYDINPIDPRSRVDNYTAKRIVEEDYFDRYFIYTLTDNDISETVFKNIFNKLVTSLSNNDIMDIKTTLKDVSPRIFKNKLLSTHHIYDVDSASNMCRNLSQFGDYFIREIHELGYSTFIRIVLYICNVIIDFVPLPGRVELIKWIVYNANPKNFGISIYKNFSEMGDLNELIGQEAAKSITGKIVRYIQDDRKQPFWQETKYLSQFILKQWKRYLGEDHLNQYIRNVFKDYPDSLISFITIFVNRRNLDEERPIYENFSRDDYNTMKELIDLDYYYSIIKPLVHFDIDNIDSYPDIRDNTDIENIIKQFAWFYHEDPNSRKAI